jgi:hypothetical protein
MRVDSGAPTDDGTRIGRLWVANLLGPLAALLALQLAYMLAVRACRSGELWPVHVAHLAGLGLAVAGGMIGYREWLRWRNEPGGEQGGPEGRSYFLAIIGVLVSAMAALVIVAQWSAVAFFRPCQ